MLCNFARMGAAASVHAAAGVCTPVRTTKPSSWTMVRFVRADDGSVVRMDGSSFVRMERFRHPYGQGLRRHADNGTISCIVVHTDESPVVSMDVDSSLRTECSFVLTGCSMGVCDEHV